MAVGGEKVITEGVVSQKRDGVVKKDGPSKGDSYYIVTIMFMGGTREFFFQKDGKDDWASFPDEGEEVKCESRLTYDNLGKPRVDFVKFLTSRPSRAAAAAS